MSEVHLEENLWLKEMSIGNERAFTRIFKKYWKGLYVYAFNMVNDRDLAQDMVQLLFEKLWTQRQELKIENLQGYLYRSLKYRILNHFRDSPPPTEELTELEFYWLTEEEDTGVEVKELEVKIQSLIDQLPDKCREVFVLSRFEHLSHSEIADRLKISISTVKNQVSKALRILKSQLHEDWLYLAICLVSLS